VLHAWAVRVGAAAARVSARHDRRGHRRAGGRPRHGRDRPVPEGEHSPVRPGAQPGAGGAGGVPRALAGRSHRHDADAPWPVRRGGWALRVYEHSLSIALLSLFALAFTGHLVTGAHAYSAEQAAHGEPGVSVLGYLLRSQFWFESFQNWQSEFLAVGTLVVLGVYLRQRGSAESKPVAARNDDTGSA
jgi:hypothetical protein